MEDKLVSIVVPVYNAGKYLSRCVDSILNQTYSEIELILINDGSTDNTSEICNAYAEKDNRVRVKHQLNQGPSAARNLGVRVSQGSYIQFVDSDDYIDPEMTSKLVNQICQGTDLVISGFKKLDLNQKRDTSIIRSRPNYIGISKREFISNFGSLFREHYINYLWNKLYDAEIIKKNKIKFDETINWGEDLIFNLQYFEYCNKVTIIDSPLYNYSTNLESITSTYNTNLFKNQQYMYNSVKDFLYENAGFHGENKHIYEEKYTTAIIKCLENLLHPESNFSTKKQKLKISQIITNPEVYEVFKGFRGRNLQKGIVSILVRKSSVNGIYFFLKTKKSLKSIIKKH